MIDCSLQELIDRANGKGARRRPVQRESREQIAVVSYARLRWPEVPIMCSTGGKKMSGKTKWQRIKQGATNKREGYEPGTPDLFFGAARRGFHGLYIEMKDVSATDADCSKDQKKYMLRVWAQGYEGVFCFGHAQAEKILDWYFG